MTANSELVLNLLKKNYGKEMSKPYISFGRKRRQRRGLFLQLRTLEILK